MASPAFAEFLGFDSYADLQGKQIHNLAHHTRAIGEYLAGYTDCAHCHGKTLESSKGGILSVGPSLRAIGGWTESDFFTPCEPA